MLNQKGVVHLLVPVILILGLIATVYLTTYGNPLKLSSKASNSPIVFKNLDGSTFPIISNSGLTQINSPDVRVEITSTLGPPASASSSSTTKGTVAFRTGFSAAEVLKAPFVPYTKEPTISKVSFKNVSTVQYYFVEFKGVSGQIERRIATIQLVGAVKPSAIPPAPSPTPTCNASKVTLSVSPNPVKVGKSINFKITGDASTWIGDDFAGGASGCTGDWTVNGPGLTCKATNNPGTYTWTHTWKVCIGDFNHCSSTCTKSLPFRVDSALSVGTNITGISHYGYKDKTPYCASSKGYTVGGGPIPSPIPGGGGSNLYIDPNSVNPAASVVITATADTKCSGYLDISYGDGLTNCRGGCGTGGVSDGCTCSGGNPKDKRSCWWRWTCTATSKTGSYIATYNSLFMEVAAADTDADLAEMQRMGMKTVRIFAANKNIDDNEAARRLGVFLDKANRYGISVIVSLIDYYNSGYAPQGVEQYYTGNWNGIGLLGHGFFATGYKERYKDFVKTIVTANKSKSNIYAWEPGNELMDNNNPSTFLSFMKDITSMIKSIDPQHAIAAGVLNFDQSFYSQLPNVDIVTIHNYDGDRSGAAEVAWAKSNNKKAIVEEFGFSGTGDRSAQYKTELNYWTDKGVSALLQWGFIAKGLADNGNGDNRYGMDTIWHKADYDALATLFQSYNQKGQ